MRRRSFLALGLGIPIAAGAGLIWHRYDKALIAARLRVTGKSKSLSSRFGAMEFAEAGNGPPVLMIHGTGGGFDQGLSFAEPLVKGGWRVIAPSRFGYLGSAMPEDPTSENQADAFVDLLDHLGIKSIPAIGGSAGALSALQFAIRHPDRCSALIVLVPATFVPDRPPVRPPNALAKAIIAWGLQSDLLFWAGASLFEDRMISALLATDPALVHSANAAEQARVRSILWNILPVSDRAKGLLNDGKLAGDPAEMDLKSIQAPTLAISLEDDRFQTYAAARHIAVTVPGAEFKGFATGGHVYVGHEAEVFAAIETFLKKAGAARPVSGL